MKYILGIDEVGRGPLAGPVVVTVVSLPHNFKLKNKKLGSIRDSKKLSGSQRELWYEYFLQDDEIQFETARVYPSKIDQINISQAANKAAFLAYKRLILKYNDIIKNHLVLLDGGLFLKNKKESQEKYGAKTVIKGDEKHLPIMIASIIAKVTRDRYMNRLAKKYPAYGFDLHKGYGTEVHYKALKRVGPSPAHRLTFLGK